MTEYDSYHKAVKRIVELLTENGCSFKTFEHEAVRTSEEAAKVRPGYTLAQGETVRGTVARGCQLFC